MEQGSVQTANPIQSLQTMGITLLPPLLDPVALVRWQSAMDCEFARLGPERSYLDAAWMVTHGLLDEVFSHQLRRLVFELMPDAWVYHCHVYEIPGRQIRPHIHAERLSGWHRDDETIVRGGGRETQFISLFVYLTDVGDDAGAFEFLPRPPKLPFINRQSAVRITGPAGTSFWWNRTYFHRASPNRSPARRRVLKVSIQPRQLHNERLALPEFERAREHLIGTDAFLESLFGLSPDPLLPMPDPSSEPLWMAAPLGCMRATAIRVRRRDEVALSLKTGLRKMRAASA